MWLPLHLFKEILIQCVKNAPGRILSERINEPVYPIGDVTCTWALLTSDCVSLKPQKHESLLQRENNISLQDIYYLFIFA